VTVAHGRCRRNRRVVVSGFSRARGCRRAAVELKSFDVETNPRTADDWRAVLRAALKLAMRARQAEVVSALRETLAAIDNAEAVDLTQAPPVASGVIAQSADGLGAGDVPRRPLSPTEVHALIERELQERRDAATTFDSMGHEEQARMLRRQLEVLEALR
jgi:uncharacterized protein